MIFPDWLLSPHPFVIHFPVGLLVAAVLMDILRLFFARGTWLEKSVLLLYFLGSLGLVAAYLSGQHAVETVLITGEALSVVTTHEDMALTTLIFFLAFGVWRGLTYAKKWESRNFIRVSSTALGVVGAVLLWQTGELGAKLVFKHGVAVSEVDTLKERLEELEGRLADIASEARPVFTNGSSWVWRIAPQADRILEEEFIIEGEERFQAEVKRDEKGSFLEISPGQAKSFLLFGEEIKNVEGNIELNVEGFKGQVQLLHHYQDPENYQYIRLQKNQFMQGQMVDGEDNVLSSKKINSRDWMNLRAAASGRHFYGHKNDRMLTHTHADEMLPGVTGLSFSGEGKLRIRMIAFSSVE